jgi:penicillin G amidase
MRLRLALGALRLSAYLRFFAPRPPPLSTVSLEERLASFPSNGAPLEKSAEIRWNRHLVPFIEAETDRDLAVTLGLVHAHLRLGQMEVLRRLAFGRLSEMIGPMALDIDHTLRILDLGRAVSAIESQIPDETRDWLLGFVSGINHCLLRKDAALPHEFQLFGLKREPWSIADILTLGRLLGSDVAWLVWLRLLKIRSFREWPKLWRRLAEMDGAPAPSEKGAAAEAALHALLSASRSESNSFAISGSRSADGSAWIASDPHLGLSLPSNWLIAGYRSPSHHAVGFMLPGIPFIALGRNPWIAWGGTNLHAYASELCDISDTPEEAIESRRETIAVRWGNPRSVWVRQCGAGPVLSDSTFFRSDGARLALRWVGHTPSDEITAMLGVSLARNWEEFKAALNHFAVPGQNMIFAGADGNVGHALAARVPKDAPAMPEDLIASAGTGWHSFLTASSLPSWYNPDAGFTVSANNKPDTETVVGRFFSSRHRFERITSILSGASTADFPLLAGLQQDVVVPAASKLAFRLAQIAKSGTSPPLSPESAELVRLLENWDGAYGATSNAPAAFELLLYHFANIHYSQQTLAVYASGWMLRDLIRADIEAADEPQIRPAVLLAIQRAAKSLKGRAWGKLHRLRLDHTLGLFPAGWRYRCFNLPVSGGSETVMKTANGLAGGPHAVRFGSNARHISKLADMDANYFVLLGGQDGWFGSTAFADQVPLWRRGEYIQVPLQADKVIQSFHLVNRLTPSKQSRH